MEKSKYKFNPWELLLVCFYTIFMTWAIIESIIFILIFITTSSLISVSLMDLIVLPTCILILIGYVAWMLKELVTQFIKSAKTKSHTRLENSHITDITVPEFRKNILLTAKRRQYFIEEKILTHPWVLAFKAFISCTADILPPELLPEIWIHYANTSRDQNDSKDYKSLKAYIPFTPGCIYHKLDKELPITGYDYWFNWFAK